MSPATSVLVWSLLIAPFAILVFVALGYRRRAIRWEAKANYWLAQAIDFEGDAKWYRQLCGFRAVPVLPVGTPGNPILCPNGDSARWSSLSDLMGVKP